MYPLITLDALKHAARELFRMACLRAREELGLRPCNFRDITAEPDYNMAVPYVAFHIGRVDQAWRHDVGLVFYHGGINTGDYVAVGDAIYYLLIGCQGIGYGLNDQYVGMLDKAAEVLLRYDGGTFEDSPITTEMSEFSNWAYDAVQKEMLDNANDDLDERLDVGTQYNFRTTTGTGDVLTGHGKFVGSYEGRVVLHLSEDHPERPEEYLAMSIEDVSGND